MRSQDPSDSCTDLTFDSLPGRVIADDPSATIAYLSAAARRLSFRPLSPQREEAPAMQLAGRRLLAAGPAHQARNPLAALRTNAQALSRKRPARDSQCDDAEPMSVPDLACASQTQDRHMADMRPGLFRYRAIWPWALMAALTTLGCAPRGTPTEIPQASPSMAATTVMTFHTLAKGVHSAITQPRQVVTRTDPDWRQLWSEHVAGLAPSPPLPQVDFRTHMVIAVFRGNTEGGFPITITGIEKGPTELVVFFQELSPPPGFPLGVAGIRQPYHIVQLEWLSLPVVFQKRP